MDKPKKTCRVTDIAIGGGGKPTEKACKNKATRRWHGCPVCEKHHEYLVAMERKATFAAGTPDTYSIGRDGNGEWSFTEIKRGGTVKK